MKKALIVLLILITSCHTKLRDSYCGYIFNEKKMPLGKVKIFEEHDTLNYTYTKKNGYFNLKRNSNFVGSLILEKRGYIIDTIHAFSATRKGDKSWFLTRNKIDTFYMRKNKITLPNNVYKK